MSIYIGDDSFTGRVFEETEEQKEEKRQLQEKQRREFKPAFISERKRAEILTNYDCVVVNDFGDDYHLSDEEREKNNKFYKSFQRIIKAKRRYRKGEEFVKQMRIALECLDLVAENNEWCSPSKFKKLFFSGKIDVYGLQFPKFVGREAKNINWDYLTEFILSDEPAENLFPKKNDEIYTSDELEETESMYFKEGELEEITRPLTEEEELKLTEDIDEDDMNEVIERNAAVALSKREMKLISKLVPEVVIGMRDLKKSSKRLNDMSKFGRDMYCEDINDIIKYDNIHDFISSSDIPEFTGDIMNDDDYNRYLSKLEEYEQTQIRRNYHGKLLTEEEISDIELRSLLESEGYNLRALYDNEKKERKLKKIRRRERIKEKKLKERLIKCQRRNQKYTKSISSGDGHKKKKKKKHP